MTTILGQLVIGAIGAAVTYLNLTHSSHPIIFWGAMLVGVIGLVNLGLVVLALTWRFITGNWDWS